MKTMMKFLNLAALLLVGISFAACNNSETDGMTLPVPASDEVLAFFKEYVPEIEGLQPISEFDFGDVDPNEEVCLTINSAEEFRAIVPSAGELPVIDFDKYTLVVGRYYITGGVILRKMSVDAGPDVMKLNLVFEDTGKGVHQVLYPQFWGLFPKLPQKTITLNWTNYQSRKND